MNSISPRLRMLINTIIFVILVFCPSLICCDVSGSLGSDKRGLDGGAMFDVLTYGAKPGSIHESTQAFIRAWNAACNSNEKSTVLVPPGVYTLGETIFQGPCKSQVPITIQVQGTLQAVSDISAYSGNGWISFIEVHGLILTGGGTIDGRGSGMWQYNDCKTNPDCVLLPASINMMNVSNAKVNSITLMNSMGFHMHITNSYMIRAYSLKIVAPEDSPNTDGIHISKSNTVKVSSSVIKTGDDCVFVGQGSTNVTINQITCGPGHGISVGSLGKESKELDVKGLTVKNCTLKGTTNGIRIKTYPASDPSRAIGMLFQDIVMDDVLNPIIIDQNYSIKSSISSLVKISDIVYNNIKGTTLSPVAINLMCSSLVPCQNVHFHNIDLQFIGDAKPTAICNNAKVGYSGVQIPPPC